MTHCLQWLTALLVVVIAAMRVSGALSFRLDEKTRFASASNVKSGKAILVVALDTSAVTMAAKVALLSREAAV